MCDYTRVDDPTCEVAEELEGDVVVEQMAGLVDAGVEIMTVSVVLAFSASCCPDLVSCHFSSYSFYLGLDLVE